MFSLLEFIGNLFTSIVNLIQTTVNLFIAFFVSIGRILDFAFGNSPAQYLPAFALPAFALLCVFAVVKLIINRE